MTLGRIDDPVDASFESWPDESENLGRKFGDLALRFGSLFFSPARIATILQDRFSSSSRSGGVSYLFQGIQLKLNHLEAKMSAEFENTASQTSDHHEAIKSLQSKIESPQFEAAVSVACEESAKAADLKKITQFALVLVGSLTPAPWSGPPADIATMIRDLSQLGELDILVLRELEIAFRGVRGPNFNLPNAYTGNMLQLREAIRKSGLHEDDFHATCSRLAGFGLALEEPRNPSRMELHERCFRPTHRGEILLAYLGEIGNPDLHKPKE